MNGAAALLEETLPAELVTFLVPTTDKLLLLPNVTIAEILRCQPVAQPDDMPNWYLGLLEWRGRQLPLVSFEALNEEAFQSDQQRQNIAVLNGVSKPQSLPFWALHTQGPPRLLRIAADEIAENNQEAVKTGPAERMQVATNGELASIPGVH